MGMPAHKSPWMTEELELLRASARRFFEEDVAPKAAEARKNHHVEKDVWLKAGELGFICMSIPEEFGGHGGSFAHEVVLIEEQCRVCDTSFGFVPGALNAPSFLVGVATPEQSKRWVPDIRDGKSVLAVCITEPDAGTDVKTLRTRAERRGDHYVINGNKIFITHGKQANRAVVAARTGGPGAKGISLFMIDTRQPGYRINKVLEKIGQNGLDTCEIFFDDVIAPVENLIGGEEGRGFGQLMDVFIRERLSIGVFAVASAERAIELTLDHVKNRKMFGQTLWDFQNTRFKLAECATQARAARTFIDDLILRFVNGETVTQGEAAMAKWWCSDLQCRVIDECLQLFGGYGYMSEYPIAQLYMDARVQRIYGGSNEVLKELIAREL
jgi:acyl-CoA dehydrogenase